MGFEANSLKFSTPVLITGASGFVGSNLLRRLVREAQPKKIHVLLRKSVRTWRINDLFRVVSTHIIDLRDPLAANRFIKKIKPKTIFHLATHGAYPQEQYEEKEIIDTNIICTFNLMQACLREGFNAFINTGTSSEYGMKKRPMREADMIDPNTAYAASKAWATLYGRYLALNRKVPIVTLRPFSAYGFYEPLGRLVPNLIVSLIKKRRPHLAAPFVARDFVFIDDVVNAFLLAAAYPSPGAIFNIGTGKQTNLAEIFSIIKDIIGVDIEPVWDKKVSRSFDTGRWVADIKLARKKLNWVPKTSLRNGLELTVDWFKRNMNLYEA